MQTSDTNPGQDGSPVGASDLKRIVKLGGEGRSPYVPPLSDYLAASETWMEAEYRCYRTDGEKVTVGYWTGEPGQVALDPWPYTEVCSILSGCVAIQDRHGGELVFRAGEGFVVPKGWAGVWVTLERASKFFVMIE